MAATQQRRFRLRFSIRTLALVVTLACCYAACWGPTKRWGVEDVVIHEYRAIGIDADDGDFTLDWIAADPIGPLIVRSIDQDPFSNDYGINRYYFWFFGYVAKLPYERELPNESESDFLKLPQPTY